MRLRYAAIAVVTLCITVAACGPTYTQQQAVEAALSHAQPGAEVVRVQSGTWAELAAAGAEVRDPNQRVWAVTLRGTFTIDCTLDATRAVVSCPDPTLGLILLDAEDGGALQISRIVAN